jgi:ABC-type branched-subunit amino acid transport system substrate-binding protein
LLNVSAVFGPWTTNLHTPAMDRAKETNTPMVFSGAAVPIFFSGVYNNSVGTLVQISQRLLSCSSTMQSLGARSAAIVYSNDTFGISTVTAWRSQLSDLNISIVGGPRSFPTLAPIVPCLTSLIWLRITAQIFFWLAIAAEAIWRV